MSQSSPAAISMDGMGGVGGMWGGELSGQPSAKNNQNHGHHAHHRHNGGGLWGEGPSIEESSIGGKSSKSFAQRRQASGGNPAEDGPYDNGSDGSGGDDNIGGGGGSGCGRSGDRRGKGGKGGEGGEGELPAWARNMTFQFLSSPSTQRSTQRSPQGRGQQKDPRDARGEGRGAGPTGGGRQNASSFTTDSKKRTGWGMGKGGRTAALPPTGGRGNKTLYLAKSRLARSYLLDRTDLSVEDLLRSEAANLKNGTAYNPLRASSYQSSGQQQGRRTQSRGGGTRRDSGERGLPLP